MSKFFGAVLLFFSCCGFGFWKSQKCEGRVCQLRELIRIAEFLKGEIAFARTTLPEAMERIGGKVKAPFSDFLHELAEHMNAYSGKDFSSLLQEMIDIHLNETSLEAEDREVFYQMACNLGYLDQKMQIHLLERYIREEEEKIHFLAAELPGKRKLFRSLGILGGTFLIILLL